MEWDKLASLVGQDAAFRRRQRLQPVGGQGDKIFPSTYPGERRDDPPRHVFERRWLNGREVWCALVDSVQSQANRLEQSLLALAKEGLVKIPYLTVDFSSVDGLEFNEVTSLDAPHRVYDAILRDSEFEGEPFMASHIGKRLAMSSYADASALLESSPTALLFGAWHSTGSGGGLGAKFARCLVSEIEAINVPVEDHNGRDTVQTAGRRTGSRIDPLGILKSVEIYAGKDRDAWNTDKQLAGKDAKKSKPSEINHGNIAPTIQPLGITCEYIEHMLVISFAALRRLRFGTQEKNIAGRTLLAALGMVAAAEQDARGYALRSRCDLVMEGRAPYEIVHPDGHCDVIEINRQDALTLYNAAFERAVKAGFDFPEGPLRLTPQTKLVQIVRDSQKLALEGRGGETEGDA